MYLQDWLHNGYWIGNQISPHTALMTTVTSIKQFKDQDIIHKIALPVMMIKSKRDKIVCGDAIDAEFSNLRSIDKSLTEYDTDHFVWQDGEHLS